MCFINLIPAENFMFLLWPTSWPLEDEQAVQAVDAVTLRVQASSLSSAATFPSMTGSRVAGSDWWPKSWASPLGPFGGGRTPTKAPSGSAYAAVDFFKRLFRQETPRETSLSPFSPSARNRKRVLEWHSSVQDSQNQVTPQLMLSTTS